MKAHRSLSRLDVLKHGPQKIALMVASEFFRAGERCEYPTVVMNSFHRARELMGLLETILLPLKVAMRLKPIYNRCRASLLFQTLPPQRVRPLCLELADEFSQAAKALKEISSEGKKV